MTPGKWLDLSGPLFFGIQLENHEAWLTGCCEGEIHKDEEAAQRTD